MSFPVYFLPNFLCSLSETTILLLNRPVFELTVQVVKDCRDFDFQCILRITKGNTTVSALVNYAISVILDVMQIACAGKEIEQPQESLFSVTRYALGSCQIAWYLLRNRLLFSEYLK